jgi:hypothetical protein
MQLQKLEKMCIERFLTLLSFKTLFQVRRSYLMS